jgi:phosphoglycolate phosphatase-like HAD superfamily hydrolase
MIRLVLFDIDGTLIRTGGAGQRAFDQVGELIFHVRNGTQRMHFAGRTDPSIIREFFAHHAIEPTPKNFQQFLDAYVFILDHTLGQHGGQVLPGVTRLLHGFARLPHPPLIGLLTGNIRLGAQIKLLHYGLWSHFRTGAFGDDHEDRNQLAAIARERGSQALGEPLRGEQVLVVGDTPRDIDCARAIGARVLAVATGPYSIDELRAHRPTWAFPDLSNVEAKQLTCGADQVIHRPPRRGGY